MSITHHQRGCWSMLVTKTRNRGAGVWKEGAFKFLGLNSFTSHYYTIKPKHISTQQGNKSNNFSSKQEDVNTKESQKWKIVSSTQQNDSSLFHFFFPFTLIQLQIQDNNHTLWYKHNQNCIRTNFLTMTVKSGTFVAVNYFGVPISKAAPQGQNEPCYSSRSKN